MVSFADRVRETTTTAGTGAISLAGIAPAQFQRFEDAFPGGAQVYYTIVNNNAPTNEWEVGIGTFTAPTTLTRDTILESSAGGAHVNFSSGTKDVWIDIPAEIVWPPANVNIVVSAINVSSAVSGITFINSPTVSFSYDGTNVMAIAAGGGGGNVTFSAGGSSAGLGSVVFSNSNGVSFGLNGSTITASVPAAPGATSFSNANNVSFGLAGSTITASATVASTQGSINVSGGASSALVSAFTFSNANNVSFGFDKTNVTASVTVASTQGSITVSGGASSAAISAITFSNANGVTFGFDKTNISASINSTSAVGLNTALTANGVAWTVNSSGISLNVPAFLTTAMQSNAATISNIKISAGGSSTNVSAVTFSNANNITFGYDKTNISASYALNVSAGGGTSNGLSAITFNNSNGVTFGLSTGVGVGTMTASINSTSAIGLNTAQTNVTWTVNSSGLSLNAAGYAGTATGATNASLTVNSAGVSVSVAAPGGNITISGGASSTVTNAVTFSNANNVTFGYDKTNISASYALNVSAAGGTSNALSGLTFNNANGISFGLSTGAGIGTLTASIATNLSVINISAGANSGNLGSVVFSNSNNVSFGLNGSTVTAQYLLNVSAGGGTSNGLSGITFSNSNNHTFGLSTGGSAGTLTISYGSPPAMLSSFQHGNLFSTGVQSVGLMKQSTSYCVAFVLPQYGSFSFLRIPVQMVTNTLSNYTSNATYTSGGGFLYSTWNAVVYQPGTGASSASLVSVASGSNGWTFGNSYSFNAGNSGWSVTQSYSGNAYGNNITVNSSTQYSQTSASLNISSGLFTLLSSNRMLDINFANSLTPGNYVLIVGVSTSTTTSGQVNANITQPQCAFNVNLAFAQANIWPNAMGDTAGSSGMGLFGVGSFTTGGAAGTTASLGFSNISSVANNDLMPFQLLRSA